jgi:hypothetical protein
MFKKVIFCIAIFQTTSYLSCGTISHTPSSKLLNAAEHLVVTPSKETEPAMSIAEIRGAIITLANKAAAQVNKAVKHFQEAQTSHHQLLLEAADHLAV